jgi:plastocyanin
MKRSIFASALPLGVLGFALAAAPAPAAPKEYKVVEMKDGVTVRGVVKLLAADKAKAALPKLQVTKDNDKGCGDKEQATERLIMDPETLGLANAVVYLKDVSAGKEWPEGMREEESKATIDQKGCRYVPHVQWVKPKTQLVILNSDAADHNIHGFKSPPEQNSLAASKFNFKSEPGSTNDDTDDAFLDEDSAGFYLVKCDVHPWMSAYVVSAPHPYYTVTKATPGALKPGEFALENVPAGDYTLVVWKEGMHETPTVADGKIASYTYSPNTIVTKEIKVEAGKECPYQTIEIPFQAK